MGKTYLYASQWEEHEGSTGISVFEFNEETGEITFTDRVEDAISWNGTCLNQEKGVLYVNNEVDNLEPEFLKGGGGLVYAFKIDPETGDLTRISRAPSCCCGPTSLTMDKTGKYLLCANHSAKNVITKAVKGEDGTYHPEVLYDDALVTLFRLNDDGSIGDVIDVAKHDVIMPGYQLHSHPQSAVMSPSGNLFAVCDQGDDHIYMYKLDYDEEKLVLTGDPYDDTDGGGARWCAFHPTLPYFYVVHQRIRNVLVFKYDEDGTLTLVETVDSIPEDFDTEARWVDRRWPSKQEVCAISADGKTFYSGIRDPNAIAVFDIDQETGKLTRTQFVEVLGDWVRHIAISPDGRFMVAGCRQSGHIFVFAINPDGTLERTSGLGLAKGVACLTFYQAQ